MTLVVDASVALKWFLADEPDGNLALGVLQRADSLVSPDIVVAEVCHAAWKAARLGRMTHAQVREIAAVVSRFFDALVDSGSLIVRAVEIAERIDHPVYDCLYVALAETKDADLITADAHLISKTRGTPWKNRMMLLGSYSAPM